MKKFVEPKKLLKKHAALIKFVLVGGTNFVLDLLLYGFLANICGWHQVVANITSTTICMIFSFFMNYRFVWKSDKKLAETIVGFFVVSMFSNYVVQSVVIAIVTTILGSGDGQNIVAKFCASGAGMFTNYFGYKAVFAGGYVGKLLRALKPKYRRNRTEKD